MHPTSVASSYIPVNQQQQLNPSSRPRRQTLLQGPQPSTPRLAVSSPYSQRPLHTTVALCNSRHTPRSISPHQQYSSNPSPRLPTHRASQTLEVSGVTPFVVRHSVPSVVCRTSSIASVRLPSPSVKPSCSIIQFMHNEAYLPTSSPLAPSNCILRSSSIQPKVATSNTQTGGFSFVPAFPAKATWPPFVNNSQPVFGSSFVVASPRTPTVNSTREQVTPLVTHKSILLPETQGRPTGTHHTVGVHLGVRQSFGGRQPVLNPNNRMISQPKGRALVSNGPLQAHPGGFSNNPKPSPSQVFPDANRWNSPPYTDRPYYQSRPQSSRAQLQSNYNPSGDISNTYHSSQVHSQSTPGEASRRSFTSQPPSPHGNRHQPLTSNIQYSNHPLISPRAAQQNRSQTFMGHCTSSPLADQIQGSNMQDPRDSKGGMSQPHQNFDATYVSQVTQAASVSQRTKGTVK